MRSVSNDRTANDLCVRLRWETNSTRWPAAVIKRWVAAAVALCGHRHFAVVATQDEAVVHDLNYAHGRRANSQWDADRLVVVHERAFTEGTMQAASVATALQRLALPNADVVGVSAISPPLAAECWQALLSPTAKMLVYQSGSITQEPDASHTFGWHRLY